jgi:hypothetical protein
METKLEHKVFTDPVEAFMAQPGYIAEEQFKEYHRQRFLNSERGKEYVNRRQTEIERGLDPDANIKFMSQREIVMQRADYIAEEKFKEFHRQRFLKAEKDKETKTEGT